MAYIRYVENSTLFLPNKAIVATPDTIGLAFEDIYFMTQDNVRLNGWFIPGPSQPPSSTEHTITLIFLHGNAGNIADRLGKIALFHTLGLHVFIVDYRGYGKSDGRPTEAGMYEDARAAYDYLQTRKDINLKRIVAYGASLGGAAAVDLATHRPVAGLIIDSSFSSAADMAKTIIPFIPGFLVKTKMDSITKIQKVSAPKLCIHSPKDQTVPFALGKKLYDAANNPKTFLRITGGHNDNHVEDQHTFTEGLLKFLQTIN